MSLADNFRYIVVEGNIGAGKTSLARKLAEDNGALLLLEEFAENTFLPQFYKDPQKYGFPLELSFLAARYRQHKQHAQDFKNKLIISDYHIRKSLLFAELNLEPEELNLYHSFYEMVTAIIPEPDLVIYLEKGIDKLQSNIRNRGREYENKIPESYLSSLQNNYHSLLEKHPFEKLIIIDSENLDFVNNEKDYELIINKLIP